MLAAWTKGQEEVLLLNAHKGPGWCADEIGRTCGVWRSEGATKRHGSRMGITWRRFEVCTECGKAVPPGNVDSAGMCKSCHVEALMLRSKRLAEQAQANAETDGRDAKALRCNRERARYRQRRHRAKPKDPVQRSLW